MAGRSPSGAGVARFSLCLLLASTLCACALETVRGPVELAAPAEQWAEDALLDISIAVFAPWLDAADPEQDENLLHLRKAEGIHASWRLSQALQASGSWGAVRISPAETSGSDLRISGEILQSDGQTLRIQARVSDARGRVWLDKVYLQVADAGHYENLFSGPPPFQDLYNRIANDILAYRGRVGDGEARRIRQVARLEFAAEFAPAAYRPYLDRDRSGIADVLRLPAANDETFAHISNIRMRNETFLDSVQANYALFIERIREPYFEFLRRSHTLTVRINGELRERIDLNAQPIPVTSLNNLVPNQDPSGIQAASGSRLRQSEARSDRLNRGRNAQIYSRFLIDSGQVFEEELRPVTLQFEEDGLSLTGSVEEQFGKWREILDEMYRLETQAGE